MTKDAYASLRASIPGDRVGARWWKLGKTVWKLQYL